MISTNISVDMVQPILFDLAEFYSTAIKKQIRLLNRSIKSGESLCSVLNEARMSYDDLVYINDNRPSLRDNHYYTLDDFMQGHHNVPVVSFF